MVMTILMKGNEALAEAAVRAGCGFYAGYPITPQSELFEYMARRLPDVGGIFLQAESEVAAISYVYGAACAGVRAMTSSSSAGISLMQEGLSALAAAQMPCVVVNVSRAGPGTGRIPPSQTDYFQATRGGGNGDYRLIVLAPSSVQEMADLTHLAFELADKYRNPVMILADGMLGQMAEGVDFGHLESRKPGAKEWALTGSRARERRLVLSQPPTDEALYRLNLALKDKYLRIAADETRCESVNLQEARILVVAFGSLARLALEAIEHAREKGTKVGLIRPVTLWPFPEMAVRRAAEKAEAVLVVEMNQGQMLEDVRLAIGETAPVHHLAAFMYGQPLGGEFSPLSIGDRISELAGGTAENP
jgi:2-oxoglutarate ferredoxin oxidoreductase subunit alpha